VDGGKNWRGFPGLVGLQVSQQMPPDLKVGPSADFL
jgi:hypothetical protein